MWAEFNRQRAGEARGAKLVRMRPMSIDWIDHVVLPVKSLADASAAYERLGLTLTPTTRHTGQGTENRVFHVGSGANDFYVELSGIHDPEAARRSPRTALYLKAIEEGRGLARLILGTADIAKTISEMASKGVKGEAESVSREGGAKICDTAALDVPGLNVTAGLIQYVEAREAMHTRRAAAGSFAHNFPLKRLDHLASAAPDIEGATRAWTDVLGVPVFGEIKGTGIIIRQMKIGDAIVELLGPDGPESRMAGRPPGLSSMCAFEVPDLDAAVKLARERGFTPSEPNKGILPGTRVASIPATELFGMGLQLLEYV
jgi:catechol 2,3-dioxygenase-like lactoylglutathione lyase family enzyme